MPFELSDDNTIRTWDYTRGAYWKIEDVINKEDFLDKDIDQIIELLEKTEIVDFGDYLKRYLFRNSDFDCPAGEVTEQQYKELIEQAFEKNEAPYHFEKKVKKSQVIGKWMKGSISRNSLFVLGFGLAMSDREVSEFLTKVLQESDFDFTDSKETVYWYCYKNHLPYSKAMQLLAECEAGTADALHEKQWKVMNANPWDLIMDEIILKKYVGYIKKAHGPVDEKKICAYTEFQRLYEDCCKMIAKQKQEEALNEPANGNGDIQKIGPADLERWIYGGIPTDENGNVASCKTKSRLGKYLSANKLTRQRMTRILKEQPEKNSITRYDLITLNFILYAWKDYGNKNPMCRCDDYIDDTNEILKRCGFYELYPVNPYEKLIVICLVSLLPVDPFTEVMTKVLNDSIGME